MCSLHFRGPEEDSTEHTAHPSRNMFPAHHPSACVLACSLPGAMPVGFNATVLNGMGVVGKIRPHPVFKPTNKGGELISIHFEYEKVSGSSSRSTGGSSSSSTPSSWLRGRNLLGRRCEGSVDATKNAAAGAKVAVLLSRGQLCVGTPAGWSAPTT